MIDFDSTIGKSFNADFCAKLDYHLTRAFKNNRTNKFKFVWCDGILVPERWRQNLEDFNESKALVTGAWLGATGQDKYEMLIQLGDLSFESCLQGLSLDNCLPSEESLEWVEIDTENREIVLTLL